VAVSSAVPAADGRSALVLRNDPGRRSRALAARRVRGARSAAGSRVAGDSARVVAPAGDGPIGAGYVVVTYPTSRFDPRIQRLLRTARRSRRSTTRRTAHTDGRQVLAVVMRVAGTPWWVVRQVDVAEVDGARPRSAGRGAGRPRRRDRRPRLGAVAAARRERGRRVRALAASEARLAATLRASFDAVIAVDEAERVVFGNAAAERLLRAGPARWSGATSATSPARPRATGCSTASAVRGRRPRAVTVTADADVAVAADDGTVVRHLEVALSQGEAEGRRLVMCIIRDVSDREAAAEALRASEASARAFVEHSPYGICRVSPDGRFTVVNPALARMVGYPSPDALGEADLGDLYVDPSARAEVLRRHSAGEAVVPDVETAWRRRDGSLLPVRIHSREVRDAAGQVAYYEAYLTDLAALRGAEQALRQAEKLAAVGRFVSGVAHELNNPLAAVLLFTDGLLDDPDRPEADREALGLVRDQALRARAIVRDLLAFVRGAGGPTGVVDARDALAGAARALAPQAAAAGGRLDVVFGEGLGRLRVDRGGVDQVLTNLVVNALHARPGGRVRLAAERDGALLRVTVDDEGPGLAPDVEARMFEPFFTTKPTGEGTGLGLSVSLGTVERYGGTLAGANRAAGAAPALGAGARFTLTLPAAPTPRPALAADAPPTAGPRPHASAEPPAAADAPTDAPDWADDGVPDPRRAGRGPRVLVVDDEPPIRQALVRFFARRGWTVDEAGDGRAAFARLLDADATGAPYDLVLSDVRMPDVSGVALHDWVARTRPALLARLVFATGDDLSPEAAAFVRRTRCRVLEKPFDARALEGLARSGQRRAARADDARRGPAPGDGAADGGTAADPPNGRARAAAAGPA
jgi:PAS domain S-box-containing protein